MWGDRREAPIKMYYPMEKGWMEEAGRQGRSLGEADGWLVSQDWADPEWTPQFLES